MLITVDADFTNLHISYLESVKCRVDPIAPFFEVIAPRLLEPLTEPDLKIPPDPASKVHPLRIQVAIASDISSASRVD